MQFKKKIKWNCNWIKSRIYILKFPSENKEIYRAHITKDRKTKDAWAYRGKTKAGWQGDNKCSLETG